MYRGFHTHFLDFTPACTAYFFLRVRTKASRRGTHGLCESTLWKRNANGTFGRMVLTALHGAGSARHTLQRKEYRVLTVKAAEIQDRLS